MLEVIDNFKNVNEDNTYENDNSCFELEDKIELTAYLLTNTITKVTQILKLIYDFKNGLSCESVRDLINDIDTLVNENPLFDKIGEIVICFLFSSLDFKSLIYDFEQTFTDFGFDNFMEYLEDYKERSEIFFEVGDLDLESFDEFIEKNETLMNDFENERVVLNSKFKAYSSEFVKFLNDKYMIFSKNNDDNLIQKFLEEVSYINIEDIEDFDDYIETIKALFKTIFLLPENSSGIIDEAMENFNVDEYIEGFFSIYTSVFEFILTDFSLDFDNLEEFIKNGNPENLKQLRFLFFVFDSLKFDLLNLQKFLLKHAIFKSSMVSNGLEGEDERFRLFFSTDKFYDYITEFDEDNSKYDLEIPTRDIYCYDGVLITNWFLKYNLIKSKTNTYFLGEKIDKDSENKKFLQSEIMSRKIDLCLIDKLDNFNKTDFLYCLYSKISYDDEIFMYYDKIDADSSYWEYYRTTGQYCSYSSYEVEINTWEYCVSYISSQGGTLESIREYSLFGIKNYWLTERDYYSRYKQHFFDCLEEYVNLDDFLEILLLEKDFTMVEIIDNFIEDISDDLSELFIDIFN